jgi:hypothetical protein
MDAFVPQRAGVGRLIKPTYESWRPTISSKHMVQWEMKKGAQDISCLLQQPHKEFSHEIS